MAFSLFVAIDNNYKTRIVVQMLTKYKNQADFNCQCILQTSNNLPSKVIFTDSDSVIIAAVQPKNMAHLAKYTNIINLDEVTQHNINGKSFLEILCIALQKRILPTEEYNNTETFIKDHKPVLKELDMKNEVQLTYLLFTLTAVTNKYKISLKNYINKIIQEQVAQFKSTEIANDTPVLIQVQPIETEIFENVKYQLIDVKHNDQNTKHQLEDVIAKSLTKNSKTSSTKLNAKATPYTPKGKGCNVTFTEMASRNLDIGSNHDTSLTSPGNRQKINVTKHLTSDSKAQPAKKKQ
ncbi:hypothetical protein RhiirC2_794410 [Rhizophagus irregularis]|uniref:Uncharacterized protein n=1 Tax=Rhizophagus irregularis TaxID=588596 RepID=A0A2N1MDU6_9GLOM|nr:hypothetical protein RhiirC2_794410 [Rhizophagus irregularis]